MKKEEIIDILNLHRCFSIDALEKRYGIPHDEMQAVADELTKQGLLVKVSDTKWKYVEKSETFRSIFNALQDVYANTDISKSDMEFLAWTLEYEIASGDLNGVPNAVLNFWSELLWCRERGIEMEDLLFDDSIDFDEVLSREVDSDLAKEWDIYAEIIAVLEVNERNARTLYQSFLDFNDYDAFVRLVTDFRDYLTERELNKVFKAASCFDKRLVNSYR